MNEQTINTLRNLVNSGVYKTLEEAIKEYKIMQRRKEK